MSEQIIIVKVYLNKKTGQKLVCIPKKFRKINQGDYVKITKMKVLEF